MWYSWRGHDQPSSPHHQTDQTSESHYLPTILNRRQSPNDVTPLAPAALHMNVLLPLFLKNVHPLVKIFFDWEVAPVIDRAKGDVSSLAIEEEALISGIALIATLTMSNEECQNSLSEPKNECLLRGQKSLEHALEIAEYTETTDKRVLQAFMLYIVRTITFACSAFLRKFTVGHARSNPTCFYIPTHGHRQPCCRANRIASRRKYVWSWHRAK